MARDLSRARAVLIGNAHFTDQRIEDLPAGNCLAAMTELLAGDRCRWPADQIAAIEEAADPSDLSRRLMKAVAGVEDLLLVYYVGHGFRMLDGKLALALRETNPATEALPHTAMRYQELAEIVSGCRAATKVLILDCCRAERGRLDNHLFQATELYFIGASALDQNAKAPPGGKLTAFTQALVDVVANGIPGQGQELRLEQ